MIQSNHLSQISPVSLVLLCVCVKTGNVQGSSSWLEDSQGRRERNRKGNQENKDKVTIIIIKISW